MSYPRPHAMIQLVAGWTSDYLLRSYPLKDYPLRIRPAMIFVTAAWLLLIGVLGFAPLPTLPINDKALHFFGMGFATFVIYFVVEVPEGPHRRVWYYRRAPLLFTLLTSFFIGGIVSEFVQSMLPWKEFQFGDIIANLLGSSLFLYLAHLLRQRSRRRQELSTLYAPLTHSSTYRDAQGRIHPFEVGPGGVGVTSTNGGTGAWTGIGVGGAGGVGGRALETVVEERNDVWDEEDEPRDSADTVRGFRTRPTESESTTFTITDDDADLV